MTEQEFLALDETDQAYYLNLLEEEVTYRKSRRILLYEPHPKQYQFHTSHCPTRAIFGGNRSGKTHAGGMEFLFHLTGLYPDWYPEEFKLPQGQKIKGRIICKDFQKAAGEVIVPFLENWLDPNRSRV